MVATVFTPVTALAFLAVLVVFVILTWLSRGDPEAAAARGGRRLRGRLRGLRLGRPTRRQVYAGWVVVSALLAFALTRGIAVPVFVLVFFVLWLVGFGVLARFYR